tara:strand:+ start:2167 stop:2406 length:240 start_codon:yes stop_codon:yes gene_type:complete
MPEIEFRLIESEDMPPIVIAIDDNNEPKVVINTHHKIWLGWKRKVIGGVAKSLYDKIDALLDGYLEEQYTLEGLDAWEE